LRRSGNAVRLLFLLFAFCVLAKDPLSNFFALGKEYFQKGDYSDALFNYKQALRLYPKSYEILNNIGVCYQKLKNFDKALEYYEKSLALSSDYAPALNNMGLLYVKLNIMPEIGASMIRRAIIVDPLNTDYIDSMGQVYFISGNYNEALKWFAKAKDKGMDTENLHYNIGQCYLKLGKREDALREYRRVLEISPTYLKAYFGIISILQKYEEYDLSSSYLVKLNRFALEYKENEEMEKDIDNFLTMFYQDALLNLSMRVLREYKDFAYKYPNIKDCALWIKNMFGININTDDFNVKGLNVYTYDGFINPSALKYSGIIKDSYMKKQRDICMLRLRIKKINNFLEMIGYKADINNYNIDNLGCPLNYSYRKINEMDFKCEKHGEFRIGNQ